MQIWRDAGPAANHKAGIGWRLHLLSGNLLTAGELLNFCPQLGNGHPGGDRLAVAGLGRAFLLDADALIKLEKGLYGQQANDVMFAPFRLVSKEDIAEGVVAASRAVQLNVPLVVRMKGTNEDIGKKILADSGLPIISADTMGEAARKVVAAAEGKPV